MQESAFYGGRPLAFGWPGRSLESQTILRMDPCPHRTNRSMLLKQCALKRGRVSLFAFNQWREKKTDEEIKRLIPLRNFETFGQTIHNERAKDYFIKNEMENFLRELQ